MLGIYNLQNRVPTMPRDLYVNDSAHHGLSINRRGTKLCVAGTMDDGGPAGDTCWISLSESDSVAVLDTNTGKELAFRAVGNHPQRVRHGYVEELLVNEW